MKILILGGLGYVGTELCNFYENSPHEIICVDENFIPSQVKKLTHKGLKFYQRDIFNCKDLLENCDVCYHLAGVTQVPQTIQQSNPEIDSKISKIGTEGTRYVINNLPKSARLVFISSHVVYEGLKEQVLNIEENYPTYPELAYAKSKRQSEIDLYNSDSNFNIVRLASVYGYNDQIRWKIVTNLFAKMAALGQPIKVFGNGENLKPLVGIRDVARFLHQSATQKDIKETYHLVNENMSVKDMALICKKYVPNLNISYTSDPIINNGYTLSNQKVLKTGFKFEQNVETEISFMINSWRNY